VAGADAADAEEAEAAEAAAVLVSAGQEEASSISKV
jgi:hypothetical protein